MRLCGKEEIPIDWLTILNSVCSVLLTVTGILYFYQMVYLFLPLFFKQKPHVVEKLHRYAVLIAARNEERVIPHLIDSIRNQDYPSDLVHIYVVADNCTDQTAEVARAHGATVFPRFDQKKVGKGYALNFLLSKIDASVGLDSYDAFLVFDADNLLMPDYIRQINKTYSSGYEAFCGYRNAKNFADNWLTCGYGLWYLHESVHLNKSRMLLGTCCMVSGTGFGFSSSLLKRIGGWNYFTLTEDIEFSTWCATHGVRIGYCHDAILFDEHPTSFRQSWRQRTRWAQGGLQVSFKYIGDLLRGICKGGRIGYSSFETTTLTFWGYSLPVISSACALLISFLSSGWTGPINLLWNAAIGTYVSMFGVGALTLLTEWKRIRCTPVQKFLSLFAFPLFTLTFIPISLTAAFRKFEWQPIVHSVAISTDRLMQDK